MIAVCIFEADRGIEPLNLRQSKSLFHRVVDKQPWKRTLKPDFSELYPPHFQNGDVSPHPTSWLRHWRISVYAIQPSEKSAGNHKTRRGKSRQQCWLIADRHSRLLLIIKTALCSWKRSRLYSLGRIPTSGPCRTWTYDLLIMSQLR